MNLVKSHFLQWNTTLYNFALFSCNAMKCGDCVVGKNCYSVSFDVKLSVFVCIYNFAHCNDDVRGILEPLCAILLGSCPVQSVCGGGGGRDLDCKSNSEIMKTWTKSIVSHDTLCTSLPIILFISDRKYMCHPRLT